MLLERGVSLTVAGPTAPRPGAGKSTAMHALLQFLPEGSALAYMSGKYETFSFTRLPGIDPTSVYAVCNEVSDHQSTYMWGAAARRYLLLPAKGYHVVTSVHADTIDDVLHLYQHDLGLRIEDLHRLGLIVNIGVMGQGKSLYRRWLTTCFLRPRSDPPETARPLLLSRWNETDDTFQQTDRSVLNELADWFQLPLLELTADFEQRADCLRELSRGEGTDTNRVQVAISDLRKRAKMPPK
jgi:hypothetical protein